MYFSIKTLYVYLIMTIQGTRYRVYTFVIFSLLSLFWKMKVGLYDLHAVCVSVKPSLLIFERPLYVYHGTWAHLNSVLHKSFPSVCVSVCASLLSLIGNGLVNCILHFTAKQRLGKHVPEAMNIRNNRRIVGRVCCRSVCVSPYRCQVTTR
jgi:hypothetical protein